MQFFKKEGNIVQYPKRAYLQYFLVEAPMFVVKSELCLLRIKI